MTVSASTRRNDSTGNAVATSFSYNFKITANTQLVVYIADADGLYVNSGNALTLTTDYTVTGVNESAGGTVVLVNGGQSWLTSGALKNNYHITILGNTPTTQATSIRNGGTYYPSTVEDSLDKAHRLIQELNEKMGRCVKLLITSTTTGLEIEEALTANAVLIVNSSADGFEMGPTVASISADAAAAAAASASASSSASSASSSASSASSSAAAAAASAASALATSGTPIQEVPSGTINGSNTAFTLANTPIAAATVLLWLDGIFQRQGVDYTISGANITYVVAPSTGQVLDAHYRKT